MVKDLQVRVMPKEASSDEWIKRHIASRFGLNSAEIRHVQITRRSIDARQRQVWVNLSLRVFINEEMPSFPAVKKEGIGGGNGYRDVRGKVAVIVVGAGPAGLFAALRLIELGLRPIVLERGKDVHARRKDVALIAKEQRVNSESNYAFGEGGAGAFSDGKLYTRSKKRGNVEKILRVFVEHGASEEILVEAHPHIGSDRLPRVIENIRRTIISCGGEVRFQSRVTQVVRRGDRVIGVRTEDDELQGAVILATGHSARDVYRSLHADGIALEAKGIAVGVRVEHPAALIDQLMYHTVAGKGAYLPTAEYAFTAQAAGRGVYSFCMCPGGVIVPAATGEEQVVVNGMSASHRNGRWSNSGIVVELRPEDLALPDLRDFMERAGVERVSASPMSPLSVLHLQEALERQAWIEGGRKQAAPAQRLSDFVAKCGSSTLPPVSYAPQAVSSPLHQWLPSFIGERLRDGFLQFNRKARGFLTNEAVLLGVETRTSSPVRIPRDAATMQHIQVTNFFPCGEGAGYAGGIVSAAMDGEKCAENCAALLRNSVG